MSPGGPAWTDDALVDLLDATVGAVSATLADDAERNGARRRERGERPGQYRLDLVADAAALGVLEAAGVGILSEESGLAENGSGVIVVVDPVDGSTNASRQIPWYATSLCAVDADGPRASLVVNLATGTRFAAVRGEGATRDGVPISTSGVTSVDGALVVLNGHPSEHLGWKQYRALGATALDLCAVAAGMVDGTIDCTTDALGPWDYLGASLILSEAGGHMADVAGRPLVVMEHDARRTPVSAGTRELFELLLAERQRLSRG